MFIVNQAGNLITEVNKVEIFLGWDDKTKNKATSIFKNTINTNSRYLPYDIACDNAEKRSRDYLDRNGREIQISVNDITFGRYSEAQGKEVFEQIITALKNKENFFDMRQADEKTESTTSSLDKEIAYRFATLSDADLKILKCKYPDMDFNQNAPSELLEQLKKNNIEQEFLKELKRLE